MKQRLFVVSALVLAVTLFAWADKKFSFTNSSSAPAAAGSVNVGTDRNGNNEFDVHVYHLAKPDELTPAKSAYVIWAQANGKPADNLGQLSVNKDLEGTFHGVTPYRDFDLFITAEDNPKVEAPSGMEVLRAKITHGD